MYIKWWNSPQWTVNICKLCRFPFELRCKESIVQLRNSPKRKASTKKSEHKNFSEWCYLYLFEYQMSWFDCTAKDHLFPLICFPTKESIVFPVVARGALAVWLVFEPTVVVRDISGLSRCPSLLYIVFNNNLRWMQVISMRWVSVFNDGRMRANLRCEGDNAIFFVFPPPPPPPGRVLYLFSFRPPRCL